MKNIKPNIKRDYCRACREILFECGYEDDRWKMTPETARPLKFDDDWYYITCKHCRSKNGYISLGNGWVQTGYVEPPSIPPDTIAG